MYACIRTTHIPSSFFLERWVWIVAFSMCCVAPMAFQKDLKALTKASTVCLALMFYTVGA
jgi:hypothetical protein